MQSTHIPLTTAAAAAAIGPYAVSGIAEGYTTTQQIIVPTTYCGSFSYQAMSNNLKLSKGEYTSAHTSAT